MPLQRLLKCRWTPRNEEELQQHDESVVARWQKHTKGELGNAKMLKKLLTKLVYYRCSKIFITCILVGECLVMSGWNTS